MSRITEAFNNKPIFMPYFPLGYPDLDTSIDVIEAIAKNGADLMEIGLSFSDPLADGPVIQRATQIALENGITVKKSLEAVKELRKRGVDIPLILMGYYNPMLAYGFEEFVRDAIEAGADGFIIPDLPPEEAAEFTSVLSASSPKGGATRQGSSHLPRRAVPGVEARGSGVTRPSTADFAKNAASSAQDGELPLIQMLAPTTPPERIEMVARNAKGFIYLVSVTGVTGERNSISNELGALISRVREHTSAPVCVGFGIGTPEQAREVGKLADGVIVGSACVKTIGNSEKPVEAAKQLAAEFSEALK